MPTATWRRFAAAALLVLVLAGCGAQRALGPGISGGGSHAPETAAHAAQRSSRATPKSPRPVRPLASSEPTLAAPAGPVNGCEPSVFGFCVSTLPQFYCCSAGYTGWSHVYVDETVDVRGSVPHFTNGKPDASAVYIITPSRVRIVLSVDKAGGFSRRIRFSEQGRYEMGLVPARKGYQWGLPVPFSVAYRAVPETTETLRYVFPLSRMIWQGIKVLAAPFGGDETFGVRFVDWYGRPAADVTLQLAGHAVTTDSLGYADIPYHSPSQYMLEGIYPGLFVQTYAHVEVRDGQLTGLVRLFPTGPKTVRVIAVDGTPMVDVADFFGYVFGQQAPGTPGISLDAETGVLHFGGKNAPSLDTRTGIYRGWAPSGTGSLPVTIDLHPVSQGGQVYLTLGDLAQILNISASARAEPDGSMLFSTFFVP